MQYKYLVNVDGCGNHNKFYEMIPKGTCWEARWGRIGAGSQSKTYADSQFSTKLDEKLRKGYIDQTHLRSVSTTVETKEPEKTAEAKKPSIGYTSLSGSYWARGNDTAGFLAVMDVIYGTPFKTQRATWMTYDKLRKQKAHCVHAEAGTQLVNDEIIVYRDDQVTIRYLIELQ